jgi:hypothetical protein
MLGMALVFLNTKTDAFILGILRMEDKTGQVESSIKMGSLHRSNGLMGRELTGQSRRKIIVNRIMR